MENVAAATTDGFGWTRVVLVVVVTVVAAVVVIVAGDRLNRNSQHIE